MMCVCVCVCVWRELTASHTNERQVSGVHAFTHACTTLCCALSGKYMGEWNEGYDVMSGQSFSHLLHSSMYWGHPSTALRHLEFLGVIRVLH